MLGFPYNISATAEASNFKIGTLLGFAKGIIKSYTEENWTWPCAIKAPKNFRVFFNICATAEASNFKFTMQLGLDKSPKTTTGGKSGHSFGLGKLPNIRGSPLICLQRPRCPFSVSGASCFLFMFVY